LKTATTGTKSSKPGETCGTIVTTLNQDKENWFKIFGRSQALQIANAHSFSDCGTLGGR